MPRHTTTVSRLKLSLILITGSIFGADSSTVAVTVSPATAVFLLTDTKTQGNWKGGYGLDGYLIEADSNNPPLYAAVNFGSASVYTWGASTGDPRALLKGSSTTDHIASVWYSNYTIDVNISD